MYFSLLCCRTFGMCGVGLKQPKCSTYFCFEERLQYCLNLTCKVPLQIQHLQTLGGEGIGDGAEGGADVMGTDSLKHKANLQGCSLLPASNLSQLSLCGPALLRWPGVPSTDLLTPGLPVCFPLEVSFPATKKRRRLQMQWRFLSTLKMIGQPVFFVDFLLWSERQNFKFTWPNQSFAYFNVKNESQGTLLECVLLMHYFQLKEKYLGVFTYARISWPYYHQIEYLLILQLNGTTDVNVFVSFVFGGPEMLNDMQVIRSHAFVITN